MIYINAYDYLNYKNENRYGNASVASRPLVEYIIDKITKKEECLDIISVRRNMSGKGFYPERTTQYNPHTTLTLPPSYGSKNRIKNCIDLIRVNIWLFKKLLKKTHKDEIVLGYHKRSIMIPILLAKKIKKFKFVLEVAEIFSDVYSNNCLIRAFERYYLSKVDKFIFSSKGLNKIINRNNKPHIYLYGNYSSVSFNDTYIKNEKKKIVYAGKLETIKGIYNVLEACQYLDDSYEMHILGYGDECVIRQLTDYIKKNEKNNMCKVSYDGILYGEDYKSFLQSCSLGVCCQDSNSNWNTTSFPSKILSYLSNGLPVVSSNIESVLNSPFKAFISFYDDDNAKTIANAIINSSDCNREDLKKLFEVLDVEFEEALWRLLEIK